MQNITMKTEGTKLTITVDLAERLGPSSSGKTIIVATSAGNANVPGHPDIKLGLNVFVKR